VLSSPVGDTSSGGGYWEPDHRRRLRHSNFKARPRIPPLLECVLRICEGENVEYCLQDRKAAFNQQLRLPRVLLRVLTFLFHSSWLLAQLVWCANLIMKNGLIFTGCGARPGHPHHTNTAAFLTVLKHPSGTVGIFNGRCTHSIHEPAKVLTNLIDDGSEKDWFEPWLHTLVRHRKVWIRDGLCKAWIFCSLTLPLKLLPTLISSFPSAARMLDCMKSSSSHKWS